MSGEGVIQGRNYGTTRMRRGTMTCPICNHDAIIRDSEQVTNLTKTLWCMCLNVDCAMTWKSQIGFIYVISPSGIEGHGMELPMAPPEYLRRVLPPGKPSTWPDPDQTSIFDMLPGATAASVA
jgi:hypothetical protein